ncbi:MAG: hypothetical protein AAGG46_11070 [Planctomycetota bacterium]
MRQRPVSVIRVGSNKQYSDGWDKVFGGGKKPVKRKTDKKKSTKAATATKKKAKRQSKR